MQMRLTILVPVLALLLANVATARITGAIGEVKFHSGLKGKLASAVNMLRRNSDPKAYYESRLQVERRDVEFPEAWFTRNGAEAPKLSGPNAKVLFHNPEDKGEQYRPQLMQARLEREILTAAASGSDFVFDDDGLFGSKVRRAQQTAFFHYNSVADLVGVKLSTPETIVVSSATIGSSATSNGAGATTEFSKGLRLDTARQNIQEAIREMRDNDPERFKRNMRGMLSARSAYWDDTAVAHEFGHRLMRSVYHSDQYHTVSTSTKDGIGEAMGDFLACVYHARTFGFAPGHDNPDICVIAPYYANDIHSGVRTTGYRRTYADPADIPIDVKADIFRADWEPPAEPKYRNAKTDEHFHGQPVADILWGLTLPAVLGAADDEEGRDRALQVVKLGMRASFEVFKANKFGQVRIPALLTLRNCVLVAAQDLFGDEAAGRAYEVFKSHGVGWNTEESQPAVGPLVFVPDYEGELAAPLDPSECAGLAAAKEAEGLVVEAEPEVVVMAARDDPDGDGDEDDPNVAAVGDGEMPLQDGSGSGSDEAVVVPLGEEVVHEEAREAPEAAVVVGGDGAEAPL